MRSFNDTGFLLKRNSRMMINCIYGCLVLIQIQLICFFIFEIIGRSSHFDRGISFGVRVFDYLRRQPPRTSPLRVVNIG